MLIGPSAIAANALAVSWWAGPALARQNKVKAFETQRPLSEFRNKWRLMWWPGILFSDKN
jgi:hypothetical protein